MSKEEIIDQIKKIFLKLTKGEPTPDDEIEARDMLLETFKILREENLIPEELNLINDTFDKLENWDTLDLWFKEVDGLVANIERILNFKPRIDFSSQLEFPEVNKKDISSSNLNATDIDISEVVAQVTEQFKGEIDNLKGTIEELKNQLHKKEERVKEVTDDMTTQEEFTHESIDQKIAPKIPGKLAPPRIQIPLIKRQEKSLKIKTPIKTEVDVAEQTIEESDVISVEEESEKSGNLMEISKESTLSQVTLDELKKMLEPEETPESPIEVHEKHKITPIITEKPSEESLSEIPFELSLETPTDKKSESEDIEFTPLPVNKPEFFQKSESEVVFTPLPGKAVEIDEEALLEDQIEEIPEQIERKAKFAQLITEQPKISPVKVEEIDTESIQSSSTDLFNVFSTVGAKTAEKLTKHSKSIEVEPSKGKKKKAEKKKKKVEPPREIAPSQEMTPPKTIALSQSPVISSSIPQEDDVESLPMDRETLYQELIALEGKRYSLEKAYKELSTRNESGKIDDYEFKNQSDGFKSNLDEIGSRIAKIRRLISSL